MCMCVCGVCACVRMGLPPPVGSALAGAAGEEALLHPSQGDIDDGNQALAGAQRAQQPVGIGPAHHLHDVALAEAQLSRFGGDVVAQRSHFTEEDKERGRNLL